MDDFNGTYENVLREYEDSGDNALVFGGLGGERFCSLCDGPGVYGLTLQPLGSGRWCCASCVPESLAA